MQYRRLGSSGLQLSALSFGAWMTFGSQIGRGTARELIAAAWDHGINFFDNAEGYANGEAERVMGDVIADLRLPRDGFAVSSKVMFGSASRSAADAEGTVAQACARCLPRGAAASARGLPRSVSLPSSRSGHAGRGNRVGDGCADPPGQGAVLGHLGVAGGADPRSSEDRARAAPASAERRAAAIQPAAPRTGGTGIRVAVHRTRHRHDHLFAAGLRPAQRQVRERAVGGRRGSATTTTPGCGGSWSATKMRAGCSARRLSPRWRRNSGCRAAPLAIAWCLRNPHVSTVLLGASRVEQLLQNLQALELADRVDEATWRRIEAATA